MMFNAQISVVNFMLLWECSHQKLSDHDLGSELFYTANYLT